MRRMVLQAGCVLLSLVLGGLFYFSVDGWTLDDAFISFRYAEHFADGLGLVYNPGERGGYSTFLWVLLLSFFYRVERIPSRKQKFWECSFRFSRCFWFCFLIDGSEKLLRRPPDSHFLWQQRIFLPGNSAGWKLHLFFSDNPDPDGISGSGPRAGECICMLHTGFTMLVDCVNPSRGLLLFAVLVGDQILLYCLPLNRRKLFSVGNTLILPFLFLYGGYILWRYSYYGFFLPNTFYAKVGWSSAQVLA